MREKLTPAFVRDAGLPTKGDRVVYWDTAMPSFGLMVTVKGARSFVYQYRNVDGIKRQKTWAARVDGKNAGLTLDQAHREAKKLAGDVERGGDPVDQERTAREKAKKERQKAEVAATTTLKAICEQYLTLEGGMTRDAEGKPTFSGKLRSAPQRLNVFERLVYSDDVSRQQIDEIKRSNITGLLDKIQRERGPRMAHVVLAYLSKLFNWYASRSDDFRSPIVRGMGRVKPRERERDRILTDDELRSVWKAAKATTRPFGVFVRFVLLTVTRRTEAARAHSSEVAQTLWTVPAERMKGKLDFVVPLSSAASTLIGKSRGFLFSSDGGATAISGFSKFKRQLDEDVLANLREIAHARGDQALLAHVARVEDLMVRIAEVEGGKRKALSQELNAIWWTIHDLRRTGRSLMSRAGVSPDIAERCLAHKIGGVRGVYDRYEYLDEKRDALTKLAAAIDRIVNLPADNVVPLKREANVEKAREGVVP
jgi:integrase